jgi:hypothetical protein
MVPGNTSLVNGRDQHQQVSGEDERMGAGETWRAGASYRRFHEGHFLADMELGSFTGEVAEWRGPGLKGCGFFPLVEEPRFKKIKGYYEESGRWRRKEGFVLW